MFQFTTTNVINTNQDYTTGLPLWSTQIEGQTDEKGHKYKVSALNIKRHLNFKKPNVVGITKAEYTEPKNGKVTLDLSTLNASTEGGTFRIAMYIRLAMNSQNSYYSNDLVFIIPVDHQNEVYYDVTHQSFVLANEIQMDRLNKLRT